MLTHDDGIIKYYESKNLDNYFKIGFEGLFKIRISSKNVWNTVCLTLFCLNNCIITIYNPVVKILPNRSELCKAHNRLWIKNNGL